MRTQIYKFWDFDGSLADSPLPEPGKEQYKKVKGVDYPYTGWWGRPESLTLEIHDVQLNPVLKPILLDSMDKENERNFILTSRLSKLKEEVKAILVHNGIELEKFDGFSFFNNIDKGQRILDIIMGLEHLIDEIHVYEDREKEFIALEKARPKIEAFGIKFIVFKVDIDADFNRK